MTDDAAKVRRVYGREFVNGVKVGKEIAMGLSQARARELEQGMSGIERKVYEALGFVEPMSPQAVCGAVFRATNSRPGIHIVEGCLGGLAERGLAKRTAQGLYLREPVKDRPEPKLQVVPAMPSSTPPITTEPATAESPLDGIRRISLEIVERLDAIEKLAVQVEAEHQRDRARIERADKLASMLKEFSA